MPQKTKPETNHHYFIENKGQWDENILFRAEIPQGNVLVTTEGITYQIISHELKKSTGGLSKGVLKSVHDGRKKIKGQIINITFENGNNNWIATKKQKSKANFQFLKGKHSEAWIQDANAWSQIELNEVYDGIDLKLYFSNGSLKYDFIVSPNANPDQIGLKYAGADSLKIEDGSLAIYTCLGKIYERPPYSYQITQNGTKEIACNFEIKENTIHFNLSHFNHSLPLIIDPKLIFSTYSGSRADNWGNTATYDDEGNLYSGGIVFGDSAYPVTPGPFEMYGGGQIDVLILKYSPDGKNLLFAAYLGGSETEIPISMIVNKQNQLVILGITSSPDFPTTNDAFDTTFNGGTWSDAFFNLDGTFLSDFSPEVELKNGTDIFVSILNTTSNSLIASTFLGGDQNDGFIRGLTPSLTPLVKNYGDQLRGEVMIDSTDNIYIVSHTLSDSISNYQNTAERNHGNLDAIVAKFTPTLTNLHWLKFVGGTEFESGFGIRVDSMNTVYITGGTTSNNLFPPSTPGFQTSYSGAIDGYVAKISNDGLSTLAGTYLGTFRYDQCYFIDLDFNKDVYVVGQTTGPYPVSPNVYSNPNSGQFIHILSNDLQTSKLSTVFGSGSGRPDISLTAFMVNNCRKIFLSGWGGQVNDPIQYIEYPKDSRQYYTYNMRYIGGSTQNLPVTNDALKKTSNGSSFYFFIFHPDTKTLAYATHYGGDINNYEHVDGGTSRFDKRGIIYQSVCASCGSFLNNFPTTPGVWSNTNNSENCNNAALKFDLGKVVAKFETFDSLSAIPSKYGCVPITFRLKNESSGATNYKWDIGNGKITFKDDSIFIKFTQRGFQKITLIAYDTSICRLIDSTKTTVNAGDVKVDFAPDIKQCGLAPVIPNIKLYTPWAKVKWEPTNGLSNPNIAKPTISYTGKDQIYYISVTDDTLCQKFDTLSVKIRDPNPKTKMFVMNYVDQTKEQYIFCYPNAGHFKAKSSPHDYIEWREDNNVFFPTGVDTLDHVFPYPGKIKYEAAIYDSICDRWATDSKIVTVSLPIVIYPTDTSICPNNAVTSKVIGNKKFKYLWQPAELFSNPSSIKQTYFPKKNESITISVTDTNGCPDSRTFNINVLEFTQAIVDNEFKYCKRKLDGVEIYANTLNSYLWEPSGYTGNPFKASQPGTYFLTGLDHNNCPVKDTVTVIERCDPELHVPNAFSPNGDGQNDFFEVFGYDVSKFDIKIFDRWGELIYHSNDFKFNWDGKYKGQIIPIGTYPFIINYGGITFEGEPVSKTFSGDVTVVR